MKKNILLLGSLIITSLNVYAGEEPYGPFNLDGGHITCKSPSGDEIKKSQTYKAPSDRFFKEKSISVKVHSGNAPKKLGCDLINVKKETITLNSEAGPVEVDVIKSFDAYAYADCGTNVVNFVGKTAAIECTISATMVEYKK